MDGVNAPVQETTELSAEFQLACLCCCATPGPEEWQEIRTLLAQVDVVAFAQLVIVRHRIAPLVHACLRKLPPDQVPPTLMAVLSEEVRGNALKALRALRLHAVLAQDFKTAGIVWMPFKGNSVAHRFYGDVSLRQVNDLDVWVPLHQLEAARAVLLARGFHPDPEHCDQDLAERGPNHQTYLRWYLIEEEYVSPALGKIDLHWGFTENPHVFALTGEGLLARAETLQMGGAVVPIMSPIDTLLYLCEHGGRHGWYRLKWLADLPQVLRSQAWDWKDVLTQADAAGCRRSLMLGLLLCSTLFRWPMPEQLRESLAGSRRAAWQCRVVLHCLNAPGTWWRDISAIPMRWRIRRAVYRALFHPSWPAWLHHARRLTLAPADLRVVRLPDRWFFMYRLLRPLLFAARKGGTGAA